MAVTPRHCRLCVEIWLAGLEATGPCYHEACCIVHLKGRVVTGAVGVPAGVCGFSCVGGYTCAKSSCNFPATSVFIIDNSGQLGPYASMWGVGVCIHCRVGCILFVQTAGCCERFWPLACSVGVAGCGVLGGPFLW